MGLRVILLFFLLGTGRTLYAQETIELSDNILPGLVEKYHVLKSNNEVKEGSYHAFYKKKIIVAAGNYNHNKKTGSWYFYDPTGKVIEHYNYDKKELLYEGPKDTAQYKIEYHFDKKISNGDTVSFPVRIGGPFFGYAPYIKQFKIESPVLFSPNSVYAVLQLLISPIGRLAECKLLVKSKASQRTIDTYVLNNELLSEDDRAFVPASINHENTLANIYILCKIQSNGHISIF